MFAIPKILLYLCFGKCPIFAIAGCQDNQAAMRGRRHLLDVAGINDNAQMEFDPMVHLFLSSLDSAAENDDLVTS